MDEKVQKVLLDLFQKNLTMPPEELPKFYNAIATGKGEFSGSFP